MSKNRRPEPEPCPPWSCSGRSWGLHRASGCRVAIGEESVVLCPPGAKDCPEGYPIRFLHGWASPRSPRSGQPPTGQTCSTCRQPLALRRLADGIGYAVGIGLFVTPGPVEPEGADERPEKVVCEGCARRLWERSERFLDALDLLEPAAKR